MASREQTECKIGVERSMKNLLFLEPHVYQYMNEKKVFFFARNKYY